MKRFFFKLTIFLLPFLALFFIELYLLPIDFFTFRLWEALKIHSLKWALPGYFYPKMDVTKVEEGDLAPYTKLSIKKHVHWFTDRYGYRKKDMPLATKYRIVIIGDSNIAGSGLTQEDIISEVLEKKLNVSVYPISPGSINTFLKDIRFVDNPPDIVIIASIEREITGLRTPKRELVKPQWYEKLLQKIEFKIKTNSIIQATAMSIDRMLKWNLLHYSRAELRRLIERIFSTRKGLCANGSIENNKSNLGSILFLQGKEANKEISENDFQRSVKTIQRYNEILKMRAIRFIFLPIPNKENIYYDLLFESKKPEFLKNLISTLIDMGIETIDTQKAFDEAYQKQGLLVFFPDDTHWNAHGVQIAADLLIKQINNLKK